MRLSAEQCCLEKDMAMDVLRYGSNVKVIAPESLANFVVVSYWSALLNYQPD
jgi:predicted DNA-binding transcriptional regulator YafY